MQKEDGVGKWDYDQLLRYYLQQKNCLTNHVKLIYKGIVLRFCKLGLFFCFF